MACGRTLCGVCARSIIPSDDIICTNDDGVVHTTCAKCEHCLVPFGVPMRWPNVRYYVMADGRPFHDRCTKCCKDGCTKNIDVQQLKDTPEEFYVHTTSQDPVKWSVMHTQCYGCQCKQCIVNRTTETDEELEKRGIFRGTPFTWHEPDGVRIYGDKIIAAKHRDCTVCNKHVGFYGASGGRERVFTLHMDHPQCTMCGACVTDTHSKCEFPDGTFAHHKCMTCSVCNIKKHVAINSKRKFIMNRDKKYVHNDCIECDECGIQEEGRYTTYRAAYETKHTPGWGCLLETPIKNDEKWHHETCPKGAVKRKREADENAATEESERKSRKKSST